jgi:hypothetical protein
MRFIQAGERFGPIGCDIDSRQAPDKTMPEQA